MSVETDQLGLPIEYKELPEFFDSHNVNADTEAKNAIIERLLRQRGVQSVYDMTCGTGSQVLYLAARGYQVTGSDLCVDLVDQAKLKAAQCNLDVALEVADIRTAKKGCFDAVISIFSAIGHLGRADFEVALKNIRDNLADEGVYVFDIFNLEALTDEVIKTFVMEVEDEVDGVQFCNRQTSEIDRENGLLISHDHYSIRSADGQDEQYSNSFSLQIYTFSELKAILENNGFEVIDQYDMNGNVFDKETSLTMLIVAKKVLLT